MNQVSIITHLSLIIFHWSSLTDASEERAPQPLSVRVPQEVRARRARPFGRYFQPAIVLAGKAAVAVVGGRAGENARESASPFRPAAC